MLRPMLNVSSTQIISQINKEKSTYCEKMLRRTVSISRLTSATVHGGRIGTYDASRHTDDS